MQTASARRRGVGEKAGLDLDTIVASARTLPPDAVTMQAVARLLGVDRSALNHYLKGRDHLLQLVAQANFSEGFTDVDLPADADWRAACRAYARAYADALEAAGPLAAQVPDLGEETKFLGAAESVLQRLTAAGFTDEFAVRFLVSIGYAARGFARDRADVAAGTELRRPEHTQAALDLRGHETFPLLDRVSRDPFDTYGKSQLDFVLDVLIEGARATLGLEDPPGMAGD